MFKKITPERAGVKSASVRKYLSFLDKRGARTHSFIMLKDGDIFAEGYYKPFDKDFIHRMYSQTKSFTAIAVLLLIDEGRLSFSDKPYAFFEGRIPSNVHKYYKDLTVKEMLMMTTCQPKNGWWFEEGNPDRTNLYFSDSLPTRPSGTLWEYDSPGSQVLCSLVEKLSGKPMLDYMKEKLFDKMGTFKTAKMLKIPCGDSWGDSAMICTQRDVASFAQLLLNKGKWNGEQLISENLVEQATSALVDNRETSFTAPYRKGYGYQIWKTERGGFAFVGMGDQLTIAVPEKNFVFSICSDNQGNYTIRDLIFNYLFDLIVDEMSDTALPENPSEQALLQEFLNCRELFYLKDSVEKNIQADISGVKYALGENPMGIKTTELFFNADGTGEWRYQNAQGEKVLKFGIDKNVFDHFPEYGYARDYGTQVTTDGFTYKCASSACWTQENKLMLCVQIIDEYFGNLSVAFGFKGDEIAVKMTKTAENFLQKYSGEAVGIKIK